MKKTIMIMSVERIVVAIVDNCNISFKSTDGNDYNFLLCHVIAKQEAAIHEQEANSTINSYGSLKAIPNGKHRPGSRDQNTQSAGYLFAMNLITNYRHYLLLLKGCSVLYNNATNFLAIRVLEQSESSRIFISR